MTLGRLPTDEAKVEILAAGANLVELAPIGRLGMSCQVPTIRFLDRIVVRDPSSTGDAVLDAALQIARQGRGNCRG